MLDGLSCHIAESRENTRKQGTIKKKNIQKVIDQCFLPIKSNVYLFRLWVTGLNVKGEMLDVL